MDAEMDEVDTGVATLDGPPLIRQTRVPLLKVMNTMDRHMLMSTYTAHEYLQHTDNSSENNGKSRTFMERLSALLDKYKRRRKVSKRHRDHGTDYGEKEVFLKNHSTVTSQDDPVSFGMHIHTLKEGGTMRHYVRKLQRDSVAHSLNLKDGDELLMLQEEALLNEEPLIVLDKFWNLHSTINLVTRRPIDLDSEDHVIYAYFVLKGTIKIIAEEVLRIEDFTTSSSVGHEDQILTFTLAKKGNRALKSVHGDVIVRVNEFRLTLNHMDNSSFSFEVLEFLCTTTHSDLGGAVIIWIFRYIEKDQRYFIGWAENGGVVLIPDHSSQDSDLKKLGSSEIRWITKVLPDASNRHIFRSLRNTDHFLAVQTDTEDENRKILRCVRLSGWEDAAEDDRTIFTVNPDV